MSVETKFQEPKVGDFFVESYGYDQTNIAFYKVVGFTKSGKSVRVQRWSSKVHGGAGGPCEYVVPGEFPLSAEVETKRICYPQWTGASSVMLKMSSFSYTKQWDGTPEYQTGPGWGH